MIRIVLLEFEGSYHLYTLLYYQNCKIKTSKSVIQEQQSKLVEKTDLSLSIAFGAIGVLHLISTMQYFSCKQEIKKLKQENEQLKAELKILKK